MTRRIVYVPFDHLNRDRGALAGADPANDVLALVESERMTTGRPWHKERLFFLISSARHFAAEMRADGFDVRYLLIENEPFRKTFALIFIPPIEPGQPPRRFRTSYRWKRFAGDLVSKGKTDFEFGFVSYSPTDTADVEMEFRFARALGEVTLSKNASTPEMSARRSNERSEPSTLTSSTARSFCRQIGQTECRKISRV